MVKETVSRIDLPPAGSPAAASAQGLAAGEADAKAPAKSRADASPLEVEAAEERIEELPLAPAAAPALPPARSGARRAAIFILSLEESVASRVLRSLSDEELGRIAAEIADLGVVDRDAVTQVIREFRDLEQLQSIAWKGGLEQASRLVERAFPPEKSRRILHCLEANRQNTSFAFLAGVDTEALHTCIEGEHPQTIAVVVAHMMPSQAAELLERLAPEARRSVLERIAALEGASAEALRRVDQALQEQVTAARFESLGDAGGVKAVAEILRAADGGGSSFLDDLRQGRPELAEEVNKHLFVFDDLARLDDRALQTALKRIDARCLALALKDADERIRTKVLNNLSRRAAETLSEEMEFLGPVRFAQVEAARGEVLATILHMEETGEIFISGRGREENRIVY